MVTNSAYVGLSPAQQTAKRVFDIVIAVLLLAATWWIILLALLVASVDTRAAGLFQQTRVGKDGKLFQVYKVRTMRVTTEPGTSVTTRHDARITRLGGLFRRLKIDELPQLWNVLVGDMSLVGPRPDVPGFADQLIGEDRLLLTIRPGITGPATLAYRDEEVLLANQADPEAYNREVIYPHKVKLNLEYIHNYSLRKDIDYLVQTATRR